MNNEINYRYYDNKKIKFQRKLYNKKIKYNKNNYDGIVNCHDGQRKLLFSEIEFYTLLQKRYDLSKLLVLYIGSADGTHEPIIFDLFPELDFYFVDPNRFNIKHKYINNKDKLIIDNSYYDDTKYKEIKKVAKMKKKEIVFISDIRLSPEEEIVLEDMMKQERWCIQIEPIAFMLKFRLPWKDEIKNKKEKNFKYLKGEIYNQIFAPNHSTETRLINLDSKKIEYKNYNIIDYEEKCYYFNKIIRRNYFKYKYSDKLKYYIAGYDDSYECSAIYNIIENYIKLNENNRYKDLKQYEKIIKLINYINYYLDNLLRKSIINCNYKCLINRKKNIKNINKYYEIYIKSLKNQKKILEENIKDNLFEESHYKRQINIINIELNKLKL